jgi:hypothetical protein
VLARFPDLPEEVRQRLIRNNYKAGLKFPKFTALRELEKFQYQRAHNAETKDVRAWLTETIQKYKKLQSPYL